MKYLLIFVLCFLFKVSLAQLPYDTTKNNLFFYTGVTLFNNEFSSINIGQNRVATALPLGFEFLNKKQQVSVDVSRTFWLSLIAGPAYAIDGYNTFSRVGLTKYFVNKSNQSVGLSIGHSWITEGEHYKDSIIGSKPKVYFIRAISPSIKFSVMKNIAFEIKANYYYQLFSKNISLGVNKYRIHFSLFYILNPLKKRKHYL